jgi:hypothetical protein
MSADGLNSEEIVDLAFIPDEDAERSALELEDSLFTQRLGMTKVDFQAAPRWKQHLALQKLLA